eukprot:358883-Chlamydomonas_euryale.AAC.4
MCCSRSKVTHSLCGCKPSECRAGSEQGPSAAKSESPPFTHHPKDLEANQSTAKSRAEQSSSAAEKLEACDVPCLHAQAWRLRRRQRGCFSGQQIQPECSRLHDKPCALPLACMDSAHGAPPAGHTARPA